MNFLTLQNRLKNFTVFTLRDIRKIESEFDRRRLTEWQKRELITKIVRGVYMMKDRKLDEDVLFCIGNTIRKPSYVSLQSALSFYGFIPESALTVTSVTTKKTGKFSTPVCDFSYKSFKPSLYFGYDLRRSGMQPCLIAEPEKAILDILYLNPDLKTDDDMESMRFNRHQIRESIDIKKFKDYCNAYKNDSLKKRTSVFLSYINHDES